jgi:hypothetical protein
MHPPDCVACHLDEVLKSRSGEIRRELRLMNPKTDPNYDLLYQVLIDVDTDIGVLKCRYRKQRKDA